MHFDSDSLTYFVCDLARSAGAGRALIRPGLVVQRQITLPGLEAHAQLSCDGALPFLLSDQIDNEPTARSKFPPDTLRVPAANHRFSEKTAKQSEPFKHLNI